jgi:hypothetical protein
MINYFEEGIFDLDRFEIMIYIKNKETDIKYDYYIQWKWIGI